MNFYVSSCILLFWLNDVHSQSVSKVKLENNGYSGIVIAINPELAEDTALIEAIKESWTNASRDLFVASQHRAYFKEITILLPVTWSSGTYNLAGNESYDQADVVIASPNPSYGRSPYTVQYGGCGDAGLYTHFTPEYLLDDAVVTDYGPRGKVIVHEWAHYRWGVFDETSEGNPFYWDPTIDRNNGPQATRCPESIYGEIRDVDSPGAVDHCDMRDLDPVTNLYPENCVFLPYESQHYHPNTSLMSYQFMDEVTTFCQDGSEGGVNVHNVFAPNDQNRLCSLASTWTVISGSEDFINGRNEEPMTHPDTTPSFNVMRTQPQRFVLILDVSGSMDDRLSGHTLTKLEEMRIAANHFITTDVRIGSAVGVVHFSSSADIVCQITVVENDSDRKKLLNCIPTAAAGGTCIGCGIEAGKEALDRFNGNPAGGYLVVLTDGLENERPYVEDVYDDTLDSGLIVETVYFNTDDNEVLSDLSIDSGGRWFFAVDTKELIQAFSEISSGGDGSTDGVTFQIQSVSFTVARSDNYNSSVFIDATIGNNTVFAYTWSFGAYAPYVEIQSPNGCSYTNNPRSSASLCPDSPIHDVDADFFTITFTVPGIAAVGEWMYTATPSTSSSQDMSATVSSLLANNSVAPIIVESGMSKTDISDSSPTLVYAQVTQGYNPVLHAYVIATVNRPTNGPAILELFDNGAGADVHENDGIYTRYFTNYSGQGRYSVQVEVKYLNVTDVTKAKSASRANYRPGVISSDGSALVNPNGAEDPQESSSSTGVESEDLGEFSRVVSSGGFSYSGPATPTDTFPPSKVTDLKLQQKDVEDFTKGVVLTFTAPGNDYDSGTASNYEIRYTFDDPTSLVRNFSGNFQIDDADILQGNLNSPGIAGTLETIVVNTPEIPPDQDSVKLSFSLRARDSSGNVANPSNVAVANYFIAPLVIPTAVAPTTTTNETETSTTKTETSTTKTETSTTKTETSTKETETTTTKKPPCEICTECDPNTDLYKILTIVFGALMLCFLTSTIIISVWLSKVNKQIKSIRRSSLDGDGHVPMKAWGKKMKENKVVPVLSKSTEDGKPVIAYVAETEAPKHTNKDNPFPIEF